jgi:hypothetical protein
MVGFYGDNFEAMSKAWNAKVVDHLMNLESSDGSSPPKLMLKDVKALRDYDKQVCNCSFLDRIMCHKFLCRRYHLLVFARGSPEASSRSSATVHSIRTSTES